MLSDNLTIQDVFEMDIGIGRHYYFVIMEENPNCAGKALALYLMTFNDSSRQDGTTIFLKGEHDWLSEDKSMVNYRNPYLADKQNLLKRATRRGPKLSDTLYCRVMDDFCSIKSEFLSQVTVKDYYELLTERSYNCIFDNCPDLAYYPPPYVSKSKKKFRDR